MDYSIFDNAPGNNTIAAVAAKARHAYSGYSSKGAVFDLKFEAGTGYSVASIGNANPAPAALLL